MKKIPFFGITRMLKKQDSSIFSLLVSKIRSGVFVDGLNTLQLEEELAKSYNRNNAICVSSGTDALFLVLKSLGIDKNDEVLVPAISFIATATAITRVGAKPVFVDINPNNALMD